MAKKPTYEELEQRVKELETNDREVNRQDITFEILKALPGTLNVIDTSYNIVMVGGEIARSLEGIDRVMGEKCYKVFQERDNPCPWCKVDKVIKTGEIINETTTPDDDREKLVGKPLNVYVRPLKDKGGNIIGAIELGTDITQIREAEEKQKRAEKALRESEREKSVILNTMTELVTYQDTDHTVLWTNKAAAESVDANQEDLKGRKCYEIWAGREEQCEICSVAKAIETGEIQQSVNTTPDGKSWTIKGYPIESETGEILGALEVALEVTKLKQADEALRQSEEKYRNIFNNAQVGIFRTRISDGKVLECNDRFARTYGYKTPEECMDDFVVSERYTDPGAREKMVASLMEKGEVNDIEACFSRKDGDDVWIRFSARAYPERDYLEGVGYDITEEKRALEALQESEEHHHSFMESAKGFIVYRLEVDPENYFSGRLVFVSPGIEDEIGISPEAEFSEWFNNVHPDDLPGLIEAQAKSVRNGDTFDQEFRWKNIKGEWGWCHAISNPVFDSDGNPTYCNGLIVNLTAQKQAEKFHFISSALLTAQERERKRISLDLHDELGQSLVVLKLQLKFIQRRLEEGQTELRSDCQAMLDYIVGLIGNIRRICMDLTPGILDDLGLTAGIRWLVENTLKSHDIDTSLDITNIDKLLTNEQQLLVFRIFQEAFTNIIRHSCASLTSIVIKKQGGEISLVIEDNGKGFDVKETMGRDFTEKGIGLPGMEERAWMLGGSVNIWSQRESGTRIKFRVPTE